MTLNVEEVTIRSAGRDLYGRLRTCDDPRPPTVVLLCGLGFHSFEYEPLATWLTARRVNTLSFDYRGHGRSGGPRGSWTIDDLATDAQSAVDLVHRVVDGPIVLFGNSLGAMVAILAAATDSRVAGVAASNCPARIADFLLTPPRRTLFALAKALEPIVPLRISVGHFYSYAQLIDDPSWIRTIDADKRIADARRLSIATYRSLLDEWDGPRAVASLHTPLLLLQGRHDRLQPPHQSELLRNAANDPARLVLLGTGHLPHLEATAALGEVLLEWIDDTVTAHRRSTP